MDPKTAAIQEAIRRRAGLGGSAAGIPGGAPAANAATPSNPIAQSGMTPPSPVSSGGLPPAPTAQNPIAGAQSMLKGAAPNEATLIIKSFADRLKKLPAGGENLSMP